MKAFKMIASLVVGTLGLYFLIRGKKTQDPAKMILGAALLVASYWVFS
jgi:hypothetical protein